MKKVSGTAGVGGPCHTQNILRINQSLYRSEEMLENLDHLLILFAMSSALLLPREVLNFTYFGIIVNEKWIGNHLICYIVFVYCI